MITIPPPMRQSRGRLPKKREQAAPTPAALTLVSASYDHTALTLTLAFDRAIDVSGFNGADVVVDDNTYNHAEYGALGAVSLLNPVTVRVGLLHTSGPSGPGVVLNAASDTGIVAVDDGGTWDGVTDVGLPFP